MRGDSRFTVRYVAAPAANGGVSVGVFLDLDRPGLECLAASGRDPEEFVHALEEAAAAVLVAFMGAGGGELVSVSRGAGAGGSEPGP